MLTTTPGAGLDLDIAGITYRYHRALLPWADAQATCRATGMELATIYSEAQLAQLHSQVLPCVPAGSALYWLGGNDLAQEDTWMWPGAHPFSYTKWRSGEPNNNAVPGVENCLAVWIINGEWNDYGCQWGLSFVCGPGMQPARHNASGIIARANSCGGNWQSG
jgi:hypothetical protein